jgi:hypothetical protein
MSSHIVNFGKHLRGSAIFFVIFAVSEPVSHRVSNKIVGSKDRITLPTYNIHLLHCNSHPLSHRQLPSVHRHPRSHTCTLDDGFFISHINTDIQREHIHVHTDSQNEHTKHTQTVTKPLWSPFRTFFYIKVEQLVIIY